MLKTADEARKMGCPMARIRQTPGDGNCIADKCPMWRWAYDKLDHRWMSAMQREIALMQAEKGDDGKPVINWDKAHKIAASRIAQAPDRYINMEASKDLGFCGAGGQG